RKKISKSDLNSTASNGAFSDYLPPDYVLPQTTTTTTTPPLTFLLPPKETTSENQQKTSSCLKILSPSGWNPPPGNRKLHGTRKKFLL
uniref:Uncharacterized protein n=1 Tax=Romanomermis culicivorax TaxID=13658 RepID=A0A915KAJ9_ROMCU